MVVVVVVVVEVVGAGVVVWYLVVGRLGASSYTGLGL